MKIDALSTYTTAHHQRQLALLKQFTVNYGPPVNPDQTICDEYLDDLAEHLDYNEFFWVVNLKEQRVERSAGVRRNLGIPDNDGAKDNRLTLFDIYRIVHKDMQAIIQAQRIKASNYIAENLKGKIKPLSNEFIYGVYVAFNRADGASVVVKQKSTAFQLDAEGNMVSYLSRHLVVKDYQHEAPDLEITLANERRRSLEKEIQFGAGELVQLPFTTHQRKILKVLADYEETADKPRVLTNGELAELLKVNGLTGNVATARTHKRNILRRAEEKYDRPFSKLRDLALFLRKYKLV